MITGLLQNKYICICDKSKAQIKDLTRISHVLITIVSKIQHYKITSGYWLGSQSLVSFRTSSNICLQQCMKETKV